MKQLIKAAEELNEVIGIEPAIPTKKTTEEDLTDAIIEAAGLLTEGDMLSEETCKVLEELNVLPGFMKNEPNDVEEEDVEEEDVEEEDVEEEKSSYADLVKQIKATSKLPLTDRVIALKKLVKENEVFTSLRKTIAGKFNAEDLREDMLTILIKGEAEAAAPKEEAPEKKAPAAKKEKPAKAPRARSKKSIIEEMIGSEKGATVEEMAQAMVDQGIDSDFKKNIVITKLWLSKMGFDTKKAAIEKNPYFKK
jgi:hypothetical protein